MSKIEQMIGEIETYLDSCKAQAFSGSKRIVVEKDVIDEMLVELRMRTPEEISKYQKIISNKDAILEDAKKQADSIISEARAKSDKMVSEHEIVQHAYSQADEIVSQAQEQAQSLVNDAVTESNALRDSAMRYTDNQLSDIENLLANVLENSRTRFESLAETLQSTYDVVVSNRAELSGGADSSYSSTESQGPVVAEGAES